MHGWIRPWSVNRIAWTLKPDPVLVVGGVSGPEQMACCRRRPMTMAASSAIAGRLVQRLDQMAGTGRSRSSSLTRGASSHAEDCKKTCRPLPKGRWFDAPSFFRGRVGLERRQGEGAHAWRPATPVFHPQPFPGFRTPRADVPSGPPDRKPMTLPCRYCQGVMWVV